MPDIEFFEELKSQFDRELDLINRLDEKANNLLKISGVTIALLMGIGLFLFGELNPEYFLIGYTLVLFFLSVILIVISIISAISVHLLKDYTYPMGHEEFYDTNENYLEINVNRFRNAPIDIFYERMIEEYLFSLKQNSKPNENKAKNIAISHWFFLAGVLIMPILMIFLIHAVLTGNLITPNL